MPDHGNEMVLCIACKRWFHGKCEMGNFNNPQWRYKPCQDVFEREQKKETERKKNEGKVQQLRRVAANYPVESKRVQELYTAIAGIYEDFHDRNLPLLPQMAKLTSDACLLKTTQA